jgi:transcriptional regulator with XRE-family HTH domain/predicted nucleotidyltransferase
MRLDVRKLAQLLEDKGLTQTELARRSGVSRATVARLLAQKSPTLRSATARRLSEALGLPPAALDLHGVEKVYLDAVADQHERLDLTGLGLIVTGTPVTMDRGFIPLSVRELPRDDGPRPSGAAQPQGLAASRPRGEALPLGSALGSSRRLFLLGDPGAGKTTALRHLARAYAQQRQSTYSYPAQPLVPVYVRVAELSELLRADEKTSLFAAALAPLAVEDPRQTLNWLEDQAKRNNVLLLIDGLDEVIEPDARARVFEVMRSSVTRHEEPWVVITSRIVGFAEPSLGAPFTCVEMEPLDDEAVERFAGEWFPLRHGHASGRACKECKSKVEQLRRAIQDNGSIADLTGNPLMLTILALLQEAGGVLPQGRWDFYEKAAEAFLFTWEQKKRGAGAAAVDRSLSLGRREVLWVLESLALEMQRRDWTLAARWWLLDHIAGLLRDELSFAADDARAQANTLLWSLQERSGLVVERGPERFGFSHLAFQEYFAARAVLGADDVTEALRPYFYHPRWREVIPLVVSQLKPRDAVRLLRAIRDDPDPTGRFLQRGFHTVNLSVRDAGHVPPDKLLALKPDMPEEPMSAFVGFRVLVYGNDRLVKPRVPDTTTYTLSADPQRGLSRTIYDDISNSPTVTLIYSRARELFQKGGGGLLPEGEAASGTFLESEPSSVDGEDLVRITVRGTERYDRRWVDEALRRLSGDESPQVRYVCACELGPFAPRSDVRRALLEALENEAKPLVRIGIAYALSWVGSRPDLLGPLMARAEKDPVPEVRACCLKALDRPHTTEPALREKFVSVLRSREPLIIRGAAARGLEHWAARDGEIRDLLLDTLRDGDEDEWVRANCLLSLAEVFPTLPDGIRSLTTLLTGSSGSRIAQVAAVVLAGYAKTGVVNWRELPMEKVEHTLLTGCTKAPEEWLVSALWDLLDAREVRRLGVPREERIKRALSEFRDRIRVMFIFGSAARDEQGPESDLDLMVIGDVSLRELTPNLNALEQELGRQVNAVVYSKEEWRERCNRKEPFVMNVLKDKILFVSGDRHELGAMGG